MNQEGKAILEKLVQGETLTQEGAYSLMQAIMDGSVTPLQVAGILCALRMRKVVGEELAGFMQAMRERALAFPTSIGGDLADNCGTGGDGQGTFNFSTASALLAVAAGVRVVKHGNRSVSSQSGSADFLEHLGFPVDLSPSFMRVLFEHTGFAFLYAPLYHPAMRVVQPIRKELGIRTVFNLLGPLVNPCSVDYKLVGVYDYDLLSPVAEALRLSGVKRGVVVWGEPGIDEVSLAGVTHVALVERGTLRFMVFSPEEVGYKRCTVSDLQGGRPEENVTLFFRILRGEEGGPIREALLLNAAFLVWVSGRAGDVGEALRILEELLAQGEALRVVENIVEVGKRLRRG